MYNGLIINELLRTRGVQKNHLIAHIGTSSSGIKAVIGGNPTVNTLEKVADFFNVSMDVFFEREVSFDKEDIKDDNIERREEKKRIVSKQDNESVLYRLYKEKDAELISMSKEVGKLTVENEMLKERLENLTSEITLIKLSSGSQAVEYAKDADVREKGTVTP